MNFSDFSLHPKLLRSVEQMGYTQPTPIQTQAIPPALAGRDVLACAMTGSGKTAAFVLPVLQRLMSGPKGITRALVLTPTRELAAQVGEQFRLLGKGTHLRCAEVFGGVGMGPQTKAFQSGTEVIVATPGRLLDHFQHLYAKLTGLEVLVLDEADRMLDMGFLPDIRRILRHIPQPQQTLFFSATMPAPITELAKELLKNPLSINTERQVAIASGVTQAVYPVPQELKSALLLALLDTQITSAIVFTRTKHRANRLAEYLVKHGVRAERIHGNRSQNQRTEALAGFKSGKYRVLVATDIAARGIDVEALEHVVNFDVPTVAEDYIHRVGRTARAERTGKAFTFVAPDEEPQLRDIERAVAQRLEQVYLERFDYRAKPAQKLEVPAKERIAAIRHQKAQARANRAAKEARADKAKSTGPRSEGAKPRGAQSSQGSPGERNIVGPNAAGPASRRGRRRRGGPRNPG